ncbi:hypothetical protein [Pyrinomonas sp.]
MSGRAWRIVGLLLSVCLLSACGEKTVATVSNEVDAIEIIDVLRENGIEAEKVETAEGEAKRWSIVVKEGMFDGGTFQLAVQVLRDHGLPRPEETPNKESSLFPGSEEARRAEEQRRLRADIERQLRALPGVTRVIVNLVVPGDQTLEIEKTEPSASVLIVHKDQQPAFNERQVQNMVAKAVPRLKPENVSITMSQQPPRPIPHDELRARRNSNLLFAAAFALVIILGCVLLVLFLQSRRQRAELAALRQMQGEVEGEAESEKSSESDRPAKNLAAGR